MEQQLIDALKKAKKPEDIDDVSKMMLMSRVVNALTKVRELTNQYLSSLEAMNKEYEMELQLGGFTLVLNSTDSLADINADADEPTQMCILGRGDKVLKNIAQITEKLHG